MVTSVLDSSAVLRYLDGEAGAQRVSEIIKEHVANENLLIISAIHWGEMTGKIFQKHGKSGLDEALSRLLSFEFEIVPATAERAMKSGIIKAQKKIPYADAFGVELAGDSPEHVLVTADFDVKAVEQDVRIEFLPKK
jgi:predicted nucleic acid-binding protein